MATTDKYDRQLRLWGAAGQRALLHSHILLISADGAGSETLKNLVLPGIGAFTILDDHRVSASDLGSNFFVTEDSIGKNRAEVVAENLCEMNPDVKGYTTVGNYRNLLRSEPTFFDPFTLIIASNIPTGLLVTLAERCWDRDVPLVLVRSYGMIGTVRIQIKEHFISDHRKENSLFDLRLISPFPALQQASDALKAKYDGLSVSEKKHIPYIFLLLWALEEWRHTQVSHTTSNTTSNTTVVAKVVPKSFDEKNAFRELLKTLIEEKWSLGEETISETAENNETAAEESETVRRLPAGLNGIEAAREAHRVFADKTLTPEILDFLSQDNFSPEQEKNRPIRIQFHRRLFRTLQAFLLQTGGVLPLPGAIPDLTSTSTRFLELQRIYQTQSNQDVELFIRLLRQQEAAEGVTESDAVPQEEVVTFCKSVLATSLLSTTQLTEEENGGLYPAIGEHLLNDCNDEEPLLTPLAWALAIKACDAFFLQQGRYPGDDPSAKGDEGWKSDGEKVWMILKEIAGKCNAAVDDLDSDTTANEDGTNTTTAEMDDGDDFKPPVTISKATAMEITRYGGGELHAISAMIGGVAAQEAVKLITGQYIPLDGLFVYNGIASIGGTYSLKG